MLPFGTFDYDRDLSIDGQLRLECTGITAVHWKPKEPRRPEGREIGVISGFINRLKRVPMRNPSSECKTGLFLWLDMSR